MRKIVSLNKDWYFQKYDTDIGNISTDSTLINLPHTWNAKDGQDGGNDYYRGQGKYIRQLDLSAITCDEKVFIEFNAVAQSSDVFLNQQLVGHHDGGYSIFRVDITDYMTEGENILTVLASNEVNDYVYPQKADFTFYGGIYRDVNLIIVPKTHFALAYHGTPGIKVTSEIKGSDASVNVETWVTGSGESVNFEVAGHMQSVPVQSGKATASFTIPNAHLWNGTQDPYLYTATAQLIYQNQYVDEISVKFGCRSIDFDAEKGFFLNGQPYPLRGVSRHQDRIDVGNAITTEMQDEDMAIIKEIGANTIRLAHYQHDQYFYDLCDKEGMIVWAEIPYITQHMPNGRENTLDQMTDLIIQSYNHPSIVCWGLSNEITASGPADESVIENHLALNELCHRLDSSRPTTMAHVFMLEIDDPIIDIPDISSYNLYFGWYLGELTQNDAFFDEFHDKYPERIIGFSEYGADANPLYQSSSPDRGDYTETYQAYYHEHLLSCINERPYLWSTHVWNMFDFAADGREEGGKAGINQKGLVTMDRLTKKDAFYVYKAAWSKDPFVHLAGKRYVDRCEEETIIKVYSNQDSVSLYIDDQLVSTKKGTHTFTFTIPLSGNHIITAKSGNMTDEMQIRKTTQLNPDYQMIQDGGIINWFDKDDFNPNNFSIKDTMGTLRANPHTKTIIDQLMSGLSAKRGDVAQSTRGNKNLEKMMASMSLESLLKQAGDDSVTPEVATGLNSKLQLIPK